MHQVLAVYQEIKLNRRKDTCSINLLYYVLIFKKIFSYNWMVLDVFSCLRHIQSSMLSLFMYKSNYSVNVILFTKVISSMNFTRQIEHK